jgi:hypothetical protein
MRLVPQVRQALAAAIDSLNGEPRHACAFTVPAGVFVPLAHFKAQQVETSVVLRSLAEAEMLVGTRDGRARTYQHEIGGEPQSGVIVRPAHVAGLDAADFLCPD